MNRIVLAALLCGLTAGTAPAASQAAPASQAPSEPATSPQTPPTAPSPRDALVTHANRTQAEQGRRAQTILDAMTPEDRVGQLFLVAYLGASVADDSDVAALIRSGKIGGIVLQASSGNLSNVPASGGAAHVAETARALQTLALVDATPSVPLFIAVDHEGDGAPLTHLREGFTALPSAMAIGATWSTARAREIGEIAGRELEAVGINMLLGPVLDVLAEPRATQRGDIGVRALGGDPFWVGQMGAAYIAGVHSGGRGRVITVAKHFPGHGASDRLPDTEVATVTRSLAQLRTVELAPFESVASGDLWTEPHITDALMTSHIRYRGFQGNPRDTTPPISLDANALGAVFGLKGSTLAAWRAAGGLTVSDSLGVRAIRRYDDPTETTFRHRDIARSALMAGNDVLILSQFAARNEWRLQLANVYDTLEYFAAEYRRNPAFAARVDEAASRVVNHKLSLYAHDWSLDSVTATSAEAALDETGPPASVVVQAVARDALTVLHRPDGAAPMPGDLIVVVTDDRGSLACPTESCGLPLERVTQLRQLGPTLVEALILERFGPSGAGRLTADNLRSLGFCGLQAALRPPELAASTDPAPPGPECGEDPAETLALLRDADWIVFALTELNPSVINHGDAVENYLQLAEEFGEARRTRLAALCFGPPYLFEPTDFHKLDVVIAAYTKIPAAIEAAVDELFAGGELRGAPPVSVEGANYDLADALEPDPERSPPLAVESPSDTRTVTLPAVVEISVGPILDHNGHTVPDGTVVTLVSGPAVDSVKTGEVWPQAVVPTRAGVAQARLRFHTGGPVRVRASAGRAAWSDGLLVVLPVPTQIPLATFPTSAPPAAASPAAATRRPGVGDLMLTLAAVVTVAAAWIASPVWRMRSADAQLTTLLAAAGGGLLAYVAAAVAIATGGVKPLPMPITAAIGLSGAIVASVAGYAAARLRDRV